MPRGRDEDVLATLTPLRGRAGTAAVRHLQVASEEPQLWFVTVTVAGPAAPPGEVRQALERLSSERPFVVSARYRADRAEVRYWDESDDIDVATSQGMRMWSDHMITAQLPQWKVVGLEVVDRQTARMRWTRDDQAPILVLGEIRPMEDLD
ncbi:MAG: hypothetical protein U0Q15_11765 [Kineosporiaceae bacterium]